MVGHAGGTTRDFRQVVRIAKAQGWRVEFTKKNHVRFLSPTGQMVVTSGTPSDHRTVANLIGQLRRQGLVV